MPLSAVPQGEDQRADPGADPGAFVSAVHKNSRGREALLNAKRAEEL